MTYTSPRTARFSRRTVILGIVGIVVVLLIACIAWVAIRALMARDELTGAIPVVHKIEVAVVNGDDRSSITANIKIVQQRANSAASLTSDPLWRLAEHVPFVGNNLTVVRQAAQVIDDASTNALPPLASLAASITLDDFAPKNGAFNLQAFADAAPKLRKAQKSLDTASDDAAKIDTSGTLPQVDSAVKQVVDLVKQSSSQIDTLTTAADLLPSMLGGDGDRTYLLMSLNNAGLRAGGGSPGSLAEITAHDGVLAVGKQAADYQVGTFKQPVLQLTSPEQRLYTDGLGELMQYVTLTPDFTRTSVLAQEMWRQYTGTKVDGVISLDPVALGYLLRATGPIDAGDGITLTSQNASSVLLSDVYAKFSTTKEQAAFFASITRKVFTAATSDSVDSRKLIDAIVQAGDEHRIHVWSDHPSEEKQLHGTTIAGELPITTKHTAGFGVYYNDYTTAKIDYYLRSNIAVSGAQCGANQTPTYQIKLRLKSTAPTDAATSLPLYVTGATETPGVPRGSTRLTINAYAPEGAQLQSFTLGGVAYQFEHTMQLGHEVISATVDLMPGESKNFTLIFTGKQGTPVDQTLLHTPLASKAGTSTNNYLDCLSLPGK